METLIYGVVDIMNMTEIMKNIGNAIFKVDESGARLESSDGYTICSINTRTGYIYFCTMDGLYDSDQILEKHGNYGYTYIIKDNPKKPKFKKTDNQFIRLAKVEKQLQDLVDEVNCIRKGD